MFDCETSLASVSSTYFERKKVAPGDVTGFVKREALIDTILKNWYQVILIWTIFPSLCFWIGLNVNRERQDISGLFISYFLNSCQWFHIHPWYYGSLKTGLLSRRELTVCTLRLWCFLYAVFNFNFLRKDRAPFCN